MNWYVVYTKPKWEKKVAEKLNEIGITAYCPLVEKIKQWSDRKKRINSPLFNSYIFVQIQENERNKIFGVLGVVRYLFWLGKPAIVKNFEIENIKRWLSTSLDYDFFVEEFKTGDKIILKSGLFASQSAIVEEVKQNQYIMILESLGYILKVERKI
jgi:transcriptional antiterminator RfaH